MDELPTDAGLDGTANPMNLADDHGLGHETAFLYYAPWNLLLLQRNRSGVSPSAMARYLENKAGIDGPIEFLHVPLNYAEGKLSRMKRNRRMRIRLASVTKTPKFKTNSLAVKSAVKLLGAMASPSTSRPVLDFTLSLDGPRQDSMNHQRFVSTAKSFLKIPSSEVAIERLDVSGSESDGERAEILHYLDFVLQDEQSVKAEGRFVPYHQRMSALKRAFNKYSNQLKKIFASPKKDAQTS